MTVCLKLELYRAFSKMVISHFCYDIKTRRTAAPPVLDPLFETSIASLMIVTFHSNFLCVNSQYNGQNSCGLDIFSHMFAQSYPCCPRTFGTALVNVKMPTIYEQDKFYAKQN